MAMITSAHLSLASGPTPGSVVVGVHGSIDLASAASLQDVCDGVLEDRYVRTMMIDLHDVRGADVAGISGLAATTRRAAQRGAALTLNDPSERVCQALQVEGLTGLIRMGHVDRRPPRLDAQLIRRQARRCHPSGALLPVGSDDVDCT